MSGPDDKQSSDSLQDAGLNIESQQQTPESSETAEGNADATAQKGVDYEAQAHAIMVKNITRETMETGNDQALVEVIDGLLKVGDREETMEVIKETLTRMMAENGEASPLARQTLDTLKEKQQVHAKQSKEIVDRVISDLQEGNMQTSIDRFKQLEDIKEFDLASKIIDGLKFASIQKGEIGKLALATLDQIGLIAQTPELQKKVALAAAESAHATVTQEDFSKAAAFNMATDILEKEFAADEVKLAEAKEAGIVPEPDLSQKSFVEQAEIRNKQKNSQKVEVATSATSDDAAEAAKRKAEFDKNPLADLLKNRPVDDSEEQSKA